MKKILSEYVIIIYVLLVIFTLIRVEEFLFVWIENSNNAKLKVLLTRSINFDSLFIINSGLLMLGPTILVALLNNKTAKFLVRFLAILLVFIHLALTAYFIISWNVLNSTVFEFSLMELSRIVMAEFSSQNNSILLAFGLTLLLSIYLIFQFIPRIQLNMKVIRILSIVLILFGIVAILNLEHTFKKAQYYDTPYQYLIGNSKEVFFLQSIVSRDTNTYNLQRAVAVSRTFQKSNSNYDYCNLRFPLVHNEPYKNVLGDYFVNSNDIKPNIVFIICESLSSSFSGSTNCTSGSLTPFVDILAREGLYWPNFFSNAEKSYGVLPGVLASLPSGTSNRGFINMKNKYDDSRRYPKHTSIIQALKNNGYTSNYYYGGWGYFDRAGYFMKANEIDTFVTSKVFNTSKYSKPNGKKVWGYNDKDLFSQSVDVVDELNSDKAFLHIYQTLSLHSPFNLSHEDYYPEDFIDKRIEELGLNSTEVKTIQNDVLSSIFFADDALRHYFNLIKNREEYTNTIFIITGDHSLNGSICQNTFENFRVPLIIYSDLINAPKVFKGVSSHVDIIPSLIALLENNFYLKFDQSKHWIGEGLDTSKNFNAERTIPLTLNSQILPRYITGTNAILGNRVVRFDSVFNIAEETDEQRIYNSNKMFSDYLYLNHYVCLKDKIWSTEKLCED